MHGHRENEPDQALPLIVTSCGNHRPTRNMTSLIIQYKEWSSTELSGQDLNPAPALGYWRVSVILCITLKVTLSIQQVCLRNWWQMPLGHHTPLGQQFGQLIH